MQRSTTIDYRQCEQTVCVSTSAYNVPRTVCCRVRFKKKKHNHSSGLWIAKSKAFGFAACVSTRARAQHTACLPYNRASFNIRDPLWAFFLCYTHRFLTGFSVSRELREFDRALEDRVTFVRWAVNGSAFVHLSSLSFIFACAICAFIHAFFFFFIFLSFSLRVRRSINFVFLHIINGHILCKDGIAGAAVQSRSFRPLKNIGCLCTKNIHTHNLYFVYI